MACVQFKLPSWLTAMIKGNKYESQDYVYMKWEFKSNCDPHTESQERKEETKSEPSHMDQLPFENIHSWLSTQEKPTGDFDYEDSECSSCETEDIHYACVDIIKNTEESQMNYSLQYKSETSLISACSENYYSEESCYSLQLRDTSKILFNSF